MEAVALILLVWLLVFIVYKISTKNPSPSIAQAKPQKNSNVKNRFPDLMCTIYSDKVCLPYFGNPYRLISLIGEDVKIVPVYNEDNHSISVLAITESGIPVCEFQDYYEKDLIDFLPFISSVWIDDVYTDRQGYEMSLSLRFFFNEDSDEGLPSPLPADYVDRFYEQDEYSYSDELEAEANDDGTYWREQKEMEEFSKELDREMESRRRAYDPSAAFWFGVGLGGGLHSSN